MTLSMSQPIGQPPRAEARGNLARLMSIWLARDQAEWSQAPDRYRWLAERMLECGEPLLAFDVVREALSLGPADVRLRQLQGLCLARSGASERANAILKQLREEGQTDEETLGMLARTYKDLAANASTQQRSAFLQRSAEIYAEAYEKSGGFWTGINAATMTLLCGQTQQAGELAEKVRAQCIEALDREPGDRYWLLAVLGEAALILRDFAQAGHCYARAAEQGKNRFGDLQSSRRNARLILKHWNKDPNWIGKYLQIPAVVVFAGHMIDRPYRKTPRFPPELESAVAKQIRDKINKLKPGFGFASAACGSDILFLETMLDRGGEITVVLPYEKEQFIRDSVDFSRSLSWRARFDRVVASAARVIIASPHKLEIGGVSYEFCNQLLLGLATIKSIQLDTTMVPLAVWDQTLGDGPAGTGMIVANWKKLGYEPEIVDLAQLIRVSKPPATRVISRTSGQSTLDRFHSRIVAILFADAVGFSRLSEDEVPRFIDHFLGAIARLSGRFCDAILARNTWGDGLYLVFSDVDLAGRFALELAQTIASTKWEDKGLPSGLSLRIGLHAGPVYEFCDPITGMRTFSGTHVSQAARIEPITPAGQVYASEAFAALATGTRANFSCDYVGQTPLAKSYGTLPTYHIRPSTAGNSSAIVRLAAAQSCRPTGHDWC